MALRGLRSALNRGDPKSTAAGGSANGGSGVQWGPPAGTLDALAGKAVAQPTPRNQTPAWTPQPVPQPTASRRDRVTSQAPTPAATADPTPDPAREPASRIFDSFGTSPAVTAREGAPATAPTAPGAHCPACGVAIPRGARRCAACGRRLLLDVPAGKASMLVGAGVLAGLIVGGLVVGIALPRDATTAGVGPAASNVGPTLVPVSANAAAALRGTTALNGRLASEAEPLSAALAKTSFPVQDVVKVFRRMSSDARAATAMVGSLAGWPEATSHEAQLADFYDQLTGEINAGLAASVTSPDSYKASTLAILATLRSIVNLDATARDLATQSGVTLPVIVIPAALR